MGASLNASWSHHFARNEVEAWAVPGQKDAFLGAARDKVVLGGGWHHGNWSLNPGLVWLGPRWAYAFQPAAGAVDLTKVDADLLVQANVAWDRGALHVSLGVQDLLNRAPAFIQPYNGGHTPLPGPRGGGAHPLRVLKPRGAAGGRPSRSPRISPACAFPGLKDCSTCLSSPWVGW